MTSTRLTIFGGFARVWGRTHARCSPRCRLRHEAPLVGAVVRTYGPRHRLRCRLEAMPALPAWPSASACVRLRCQLGAFPREVRMNVTVLSGGGGGARFLRGVVAVVDPDDVAVVGNVADDIEIL